MLLAFLIVALGGSLGAMARYVTVLFAERLGGLEFPFGTLLVNTLGSFLAGFFLSLLIGRYSGEIYLRLFFFTGFLGAFTTFSSFAAESMFMFEHSQWQKLAINILMNNIGSLLMVLLGAYLARYIILGSFNHH